MPFRGAGTRPQALKNGLFYWDGSPLLQYTGGTYYDIGRIV
nr:MAG TPA: hypothetical protein [Caudoviricetes sp.]